MREAAYQTKLVERINAMFPGCFILRNDPRETQGMPDILVLYGTKWAMLEVKISRMASQQPNQDYYVNMFDDMSFASFIYPENEEQVLYDLQRALGSGRKTRVS